MKNRDDNAEDCRIWRLYKRTEEQRRAYKRRSVLERRLQRLWRKLK